MAWQTQPTHRRWLEREGDRLLDFARGARHPDGGFAWLNAAGPIDRRKQTYGHAFVVLTASSAARSGYPLARRLLDDALEVMETRFWSEADGMVVDTYDETFTELSPYRGLNANMHTVEAFLAAGDVTGDRDVEGSGSVSPSSTSNGGSTSTRGCATWSAGLGGTSWTSSTSHRRGCGRASRTSTTPCRRPSSPTGARRASHANACAAKPVFGT